MEYFQHSKPSCLTCQRKTWTLLCFKGSGSPSRSWRNVPSEKFQLESRKSGRNSWPPERPVPSTWTPRATTKPPRMSKTPAATLSRTHRWEREERQRNLEAMPCVFSHRHHGVLCFKKKQKTGTHLQVDEEWLIQPLHSLQCLPGVITGQKEGNRNWLVTLLCFQMIT